MAAPPSMERADVFKSECQKRTSSPPKATTRASTALRGTFLWVMIGVSRVTTSGEEENKTAVIDDVTYCSAQNTNPKGNAIMVTERTRRAFHCSCPLGHFLFCPRARPINNRAPIRKRRPAA